MHKTLQMHKKYLAQQKNLIVGTDIVLSIFHKGKKI